MRRETKIYRIAAYMVVAAALILIVFPLTGLLGDGSGSAIAAAATEEESGAEDAKEGAAGSSGTGVRITSIEDMAHARVGMIEGTIFHSMVAERFPEATQIFLNTSSEMASALQSGQIDCFLQNEVSVKEMADSVPGVSYLDEPFSVESYGAIFPKDSAGLPEEINEQIEQLWDDGTIEALRVKWMDGPDEEKVMDDIVFDGTKGTLRMATDDSKLPFSYRDKDGYTGYDIELMSVIAKRLGYKLEITGMNFGSLIPAISSGKYDFASAGIAYTDERAEAVLFSDPIYYGDTVCAIYEKPSGGEGIRQAFVSGIENTFITENRWRLILDGLLVTLRITLLSVIFGTALGFCFYFMRISRFRVFRVIVSVIARIMDGLPEVVVLLVAAYIIFRSASISDVWVATIAFTVLFAVGFAHTLKVGVDSLDGGQTEAAHALGFENREVFTLIVFPQAARNVLSVYLGQITRLLKGRR
ncbi:MAG: transporter substrate-binding domain-containing protein [Clostridiales Family XIII bacterium]|jgi:polar amino acid transport system substrate-binding protein|nr:transporter substrate-binding domain-containing protein [Clostridiales Family XIII bacterium]